MNEVVEEEPVNVGGFDQCVGTISANKPDAWYETLTVFNISVKFNLNTGEQANIIPNSLLKNTNPSPTISQSNVKLKTYNSGEINIIGQIETMIQRQDVQQINLLFYIADLPTAQPLLGRNACIQVGLIERTTALVVHNILQQYHDVFEELRIIKGKQHKIHVDTSVIPVFHPPRKVPFPMLNRLREQLSQLEHLTVIQKVDHPTDWVNSLTIVERANGQLRLCLDPKVVNKATKRHNYEMPTAETVFAKMSGATVFSKLDASNGYWQIAVGSESSDLLTFNTLFGRYKFLRIPFGLKSASEVFQKAVAEILEQLEGVQNMQDNIVDFVLLSFNTTV